MVIYKVEKKIVIPEDYVFINMTEKELRRLLSPQWKQNIIFEDVEGNLYWFHGSLKNVVIVESGNRI